MNKSASKIKLSSYDDLFQTEVTSTDPDNKDKIVEMPLDKLFDADNHPFKVIIDDKMLELADSISKHGVLHPGLVRPRPDGNYSIVAGHRRKCGSKLAGLTTMPVIIKDMTDEEAIIAMVDSNIQREQVLPSEKAFAYKMRLEALRRQAGRPKGNSDQVGPNFIGVRSNEELAKQVGDTASQIKRYIRLTELIPELLDMVDKNKLKLNPAVEISYLTKEQQDVLLGVMGEQQIVPSLVQAQALKKISQDNQEANVDFAKALLEILRPKKNKQTVIKINRQRLDRFVQKMEADQEDIEETIVKALTVYYQLKDENSKELEEILTYAPEPSITV